jgi:hypothetical protein
MASSSASVSRPAPCAHADRAQARQPQDLQQIAIARRFHQYRVAGPQRRAHDQIQRLRGALRQHHLLRLHRECRTGSGAAAICSRSVPKP